MVIKTVEIFLYLLADLAEEALEECITRLFLEDERTVTMQQPCESRLEIL
jgi:hypothetical protein